MGIDVSEISGSWSASPTPFKEDLAIDTSAVKRMIIHHFRTGQKGVFFGGTCGEGPFMRKNDYLNLISTAASANTNKLFIAAQATDNSFARVLDNIHDLKSAGADIAVLAEPWFLTPLIREEVLEGYYLNSVEKSALPICIYIRGTDIPLKIIEKVILHPNVCAIKDSSNDEKIVRLLKTIRNNKNFALMTGCELAIKDHLRQGYDGAMSGGGILIGKLVVNMVEHAKKGDFDAVSKLQQHCNEINYTAYGGKNISSWLTGLKYTLIKLGIFNTLCGYLKYPLSQKIKDQIDKMLEKERENILP